MWVSKGIQCSASPFCHVGEWKKAVDTKNVLTDLSKAIDCLSHDLVITKPNTYEFSLPALNLIQNYLAN